MEILSTITYEAGSLDKGTLIVGCLLLIAAIVVIGLGIIACKTYETGAGILAFVCATFFAVFGIFMVCNCKYPITYHEYDVIFTEPIDMDEFGAKYEIKSQKGRIYHIEERH